MAKMSDLCPKCHGLVMQPGKAYGYAGPVCACKTLLNDIMPSGWQCPACKVVHAPHVAACTCTGGGK